MPGATLQEPDPQLIRAAIGGDRSAFGALVRLYQGDVWRMSFHLVRDETLAEDITQDAFVRAYRFLSRYRGESKFSTWLFSIARNCALDELRRASRRRKVTERLDAQPEPERSDPSVVLEVREAVAKLPPDLREPIVLIDICGLSYKEACEVLKVPEGTVKSRVHRGRETLAEILVFKVKETPNEV
jgi:RNA polymerase sigma-70 factor, ECF subfamily